MTSLETAPTADRSARRAWLVTAGALGLYLVGTQVPLPGLDAGALQPQNAAPSGLLGLLGYHAPLVPVLNVSLGWLVLVRGALGLLLGDEARPAAGFNARRWRLAGLLGYLAGSSGQAFVLLRYLEQATGPNGQALLAEPGWLFRLSAFATLLGGAAVVWLLATWITREGVGHGTLLLLAFTSLIQGTNGLFLLGQQSGGGAGSFGLLASGWLTVVPFAASAFALWRWPPASWPVSLPLLRPTLGWLDVLVSPVAVSAVLVMPVMAVVWLLYAVAPEALTALSQLHYWLALLQPILTLAIVVGLALWWRSRMAGGQRRTALLATAVALPLLGAALLAAGFAAGGGHWRAPRPHAYAGAASFEIVLESAQGGGSHDAKVLLERLDELGVQGEMVEATEQRMVVRLHDVSDEASVMAAAFPQGRLAFYFVAQDQGPLAPRPGEDAPPGLLIVRDRDSEIFIGPTAESLVPILDRAPHAAGRLARVECRAEVTARQWPAPPRPRPSPAPGQGECLVRLLEEPAVITGEDVADATVGADPSTGRPTVTLAFSSEGAQRFEEVTRSHIGRLLSIVLDDRIESSPVIQTAIAGGRALITLGATPAGGPEAQRRQAESLVTALRHGALQGRWTKTSVRQLD